MKKIKCDICNKQFQNENALVMHNKSKHYSKSKNSSKLLIGMIVAIAIIIVILFFISKSGNNKTNSSNSEGLQKVTLGFTDNYDPNTIEVKAGIPVEITLDNSVGGCYRAFTIPELSVSKISRTPSDTIKFTPKQPGIYRFQCGMNMGYGTLIVS